MRPDIEQEILTRFAEPARRDRLLWLAVDPKRRGRLLESLLRDTRNLRRSLLHELTGLDKMPERLIPALRALGVRSTVYVMSSNEDHDGTEQDLEQLVCGLGDAPPYYEEVLAYCSVSRAGFFRNHEDWIFLLKGGR